MQEKKTTLSVMASRGWFWMIVGLLSVVAIFFLFTMPNAFFLIDRPVAMDREAALKAARETATAYDIGPAEYREALVYRTDNFAKSFIELEGGGVEVLNEAISNGIYSPYAWHVRHFNENRIQEAVLFFSSDGRFMGFHETLPEKETGADLEEAAARDLAEEILIREYGYDMGVWQLVETSSDEKISGRKDWTFVYEGTTQPFHDGRIRISTTLSGNRLTEVNKFLKVPESFERRFAKARSWNGFISVLSLLGVVLFFAGCAWGFVYLLRRKMLIWKMPLLFGIGLSLSMVLSNLNNLPVEWMNYSTALSDTAFIVRLLVTNLLLLVVMGAVYSFSIMVAEGLTRSAFPNHIQFWKLFSPAASGTTLKKTGGGLLAVPFWLFYVFLFYYVTKNVFGWWVPAESLINPNVVAQYLPWFTPFAGSIQAGVWEELFFRAVPIAGAALIGERLKKRNLLIGLAVALQAIIFAAGHANYPGLPGYSRLVELVLPSVVMGLIYIRFGILPGIMIHFGYDLVLMAQPIFSSPGPWMLFNRAVVILILVFPLLYALMGHFRRGAGALLPVNRAWFNKYHQQAATETGTPVIETYANNDRETSDDTDLFELPDEPHFPDATSANSHKTSGRFFLLACAAIGLGLWLVCTDFSGKTDGLQIQRREAEAIADTAVEQQGIHIPPTWRRSANVITGPGTGDHYVWSTAPDEYHQFKGRYLPPNCWRVRYADFEGAPENRESYEVMVSDEGRAIQIIHRIPEAKPGPSLDRAAAEKMAMAILEKQFRIGPDDARQVSGKDEKRPQRVDWTFDYVIPKDSMENIDTRVKIQIAGDEVINAHRYIFIPEEWQRSFESRSSSLKVASVVSGLLIFAAIVAGVVQGLMALSGKRFSGKVFRIVGGIFLLGSAADFANGWLATTGNFTLVVPYGIQATIIAVFGGVFVIVFSAVYAVVAGFLWAGTKRGGFAYRKNILPGLGVGLGIAGATALCGKLIPTTLPAGANLTGVDAAFPWAAAPLVMLTDIPSSIIGIGLALLWFRGLQNGPLFQKIMGVAIVFLIAAASSGMGNAPNLGSFLAVSAIVGGCWVVSAFTVFSRSSAALPIAVAVAPVLGLIGQMVQNPYPDASTGTILGLVVTLGVCFLFLRFREVRE